jgi:putative oxidoreductase
MSSLATRCMVTGDSWAPLPLRLALGVVFFAHGSQKLLGWFGGPGFSGAMGYLTRMEGLPWIIGLLVIVIEFFGGLAVLLGLLTRPTVFAIGVEMVGAILKVHAANGFFMNWSGRQAGEGFEFHLLVIAMVLALLVLGGGRWSVDRALAGPEPPEATPRGRAAGA